MGWQLMPSWLAGMPGAAEWWDPIVSKCMNRGILLGRNWWRTEKMFESD